MSRINFNTVYRVKFQGPQRKHKMMTRLILLLVTGVLMHNVEAQNYQFDPVPEPVENPVTEAKRVLGKILFWDEQLSSNDTVACVMRGCATS